MRQEHLCVYSQLNLPGVTAENSIPGTTYRRKCVPREPLWKPAVSEGKYETMNATYTEDVFHGMAGRLNPLASFHVSLGTFMLYRLSAGKSYNRNGVSWSPLAHMQPKGPLMVPLTLLWADWKTSWGPFQPSWFSDSIVLWNTQTKEQTKLMAWFLSSTWAQLGSDLMVWLETCWRSRSSSTPEYLHHSCS